MTTITQHIPGKPQEYPIIIEDDAIGQIPTLIKEQGDVDQVFILYDENLADLAEKIQGSIEGSQLISIESGEQSKCLDMVEEVAMGLTEAGASRKSLLICVGGGMMTDLGGFVASVYMRGIRFINVSTSLLGMCDAAIGGKTAIDLNHYKNLIGTTYHPIAIIIDLSVLATLPDHMLRCGIVEVIKKAMILDAEVFEWFEDNMETLLDRDLDVLRTCIEHAARMKVDVVESDEKEGHRRKFLNFGHTIGHAVEAYSQFQIAHGEAVSIGMVAEMKIDRTPNADRLIALLEKLHMPLQIPPNQDPGALWDIMLHDKKTVAGEVHIAVPTEIGNGHVRQISKEEFLSSL